MEAGADIREGGSGGQSQAGRDRFLVGVAFAAPARPFLPRRAARRSGGGSAAATGAARGRGAGSRGRGDAGRGVRNDQQSFAKLWYVIPVTASTAMQSLGLTQISRLYLRSWLWDTPPRECVGKWCLEHRHLVGARTGIHRFPRVLTLCCRNCCLFGLQRGLVTVGRVGGDRVGSSLES
uniref:Uncharacterized protein n=1 Tax=Rangifer tarandus platyrhynchus TaxID=3082113 RepID=A0ACB0F0J3_RANTA|nr:unnamed protein product [Rangifer tarandus platyrhynchus]